MENKYSHGNDKIIQKCDDNDKLGPKFGYRPKTVKKGQWFGHIGTHKKEATQKTKQQQQKHKTLTTRKNIWI